MTPGKSLQKMRGTRDVSCIRMYPASCVRAAETRRHMLVLRRALPWIVFLLVLLVLQPVEAIAQDFSRQIRKEYELPKLKKKDLEDSTVKVTAAVVFTVLSNTSETHSHQMDGQTNNEVWLHEDGQTEAVFVFDRDENGQRVDGTGKLVTDCLNMGSYNYFHPYTQPLGHFTSDTLPWLKLGNCPEDPSSVDQRIDAFLLDFEAGLQISLENGGGFYLPEGFRFKGEGQSAAVAFFLKALDHSDYDLPQNTKAIVQSESEREEFLKAIEVGFKAAINGP